MMMSSFNHTRRHSSRFETLETRRHLSAAALDNPVVALEWHGQQTRAEAGEYILSLDPSARLVNGRAASRQVAALQNVLDQKLAGVRVEEYLGRSGEFLLDAPADTGYDQVLAAVKPLKGFEFLEPNFVLQFQATPNDPLFGYEYALNNTGTTPAGASKADADIDAVEAWDVATGAAGGSAVVVGVVDSGVDYSHPDLAASMWRNPFETAGDGIDNDRNGYVDDVYGINAITGSGNPTDDNGHGTHTAGTIAAAVNNGVGVAGVSWGAKVMALKFLAADGSGSLADAVECLNYATAMRQKGVNIRLTSNSWGGGGFEQSLRDAVARSGDAGMLFVAAAGNGGADGIGDNNDVTPSYPSNLDLVNVVAVAATDRYDNLAGFSNYGATQVDLAAPGVDIASTYPGGQYVYMSGTSMATPQVSGVAALAFAFKPDSTTADVRGALLNGVDKLSNLTGKVATGGRLNALGTLRQLANSVGGVAFDDADGDGTRGGAEAALAGRTVFLDANNNGALDAGEPARTTDGAGAYRFGALLPGTYTVRQVVPAGWAATAPAAGAYTVTVADGQNFTGRNFGSRLVPVNPAPTAAATLSDPTAGGTHHWFKVTYADDTAVAYGTIGSGDVLVTGPGGYSQPGTLSNLTYANNAWTATYRVPAPGGAWDAADNGAYTVSMRANEVSDTAGAFVAAGALGQFSVRLGDTVAPTATLAAANVTAAGGGYQWFKVTYADDVGVAYGTIDGNDVLVTGPNAYSQKGVLSNLTYAAGAWTATYRVPAPGGTFGTEDNGTYTVALVAGQVADTSGNHAAAGVLGGFDVAVPQPVTAAGVTSPLFSQDRIAADQLA
jgi:hypothetical protein